MFGNLQSDFSGIDNEYSGIDVCGYGIQSVVAENWQKLFCCL